ncbi:MULTISPECIES: Fur family transcriptional regulator [unclassified Nocardioides]|uniref:Fur family transcriptional regulator n=1 Tax=unclassified Nocardioides TaxID=2615069 RepID=UPI000703B7F1|nr:MULTISPECIES: Fur family transcriptional regulator [unclassified Nocardioides]KRC53947.1 Fur family transcriptional regulator [Nocardioides sp. Root79]KRC71283.1 Fur family transcriptional regulator [Nocardioides sp. Root240]
MTGTDERPTALRPTRQRLAITAALSDAVDFQSAQEIHDVLRRGNDKVGLATVYRTLQAMAESGEVDVRHGPAGEASYRRCSASHHHHLVCRSCGRTVEITGSAVEKWAHAVADEHGFTDVAHTVELIGLCADCSAAARGN